MDKSMIREAANKIRECVDFSWHNIGNSAKLEEARKLLDTILAELDKPGEGEVRGTGKVLTDEELERCYQRRRLAHAESSLTADEAHKAASEYKAGMLQARLRYLAPAKAPAEVVELVEKAKRMVWNPDCGDMVEYEYGPYIDRSELLAALKSNTPEHADQ